MNYDVPRTVAAMWAEWAQLHPAQATCPPCRRAFYDAAEYMFMLMCEGNFSTEHLDEHIILSRERYDIECGLDREFSAVHFARRVEARANGGE